MRGGKVLYGDDAAVDGARRGELRHRRRLRHRQARVPDGRDRQDARRRCRPRPARRSIRRSSAARRRTSRRACRSARPRSAGSTIYTGALDRGRHRRRRHPRRDGQLPARCSTRSARSTTACRATSTTTASATPAIRARSTRTPRTAPSSIPNDRDHDGIAERDRQLPRRREPRSDRHRPRRQGRRLRRVPERREPGRRGLPGDDLRHQERHGRRSAPPVHVANALVTGKGTNGFFVQVKEGDTGYAGPDNSGLFVFTGTRPRRCSRTRSSGPA